MRERRRYSGCKKQVEEEGGGGRREGERKEGRREKTIEYKIIKQRKDKLYGQEDR